MREMKESTIMRWIERGRAGNRRRRRACDHLTVSGMGYHSAVIDIQNRPIYALGSGLGHSQDPMTTDYVPATLQTRRLVCGCAKFKLQKQGPFLGGVWSTPKIILKQVQQGCSPLRRDVISDQDLGLVG